jgi:hypothetical protein
MGRVSLWALRLGGSEAAGCTRFARGHLSRVAKNASGTA